MTGVQIGTPVRYNSQNNCHALHPSEAHSILGILTQHIALCATTALVRIGQAPARPRPATGFAEHPLATSRPRLSSGEHAPSHWPNSGRPRANIVNVAEGSTSSVMIFRHQQAGRMKLSKDPESQQPCAHRGRRSQAGALPREADELRHLRRSEEGDAGAGTRGCLRRQRDPSPV